MIFETGAQHSFWEVNLGNVITLGALLLSFWTAHRGNIKRIEDAASRMTEIETKLSLIYDWFQNNVVGKGEPQRGHGD